MFRHLTFNCLKSNGACIELIDTGPELIQICGVTHTDQILTYGAVVKLHTVPLTWKGGLNSSTRQ